MLSMEAQGYDRDVTAMRQASQQQQKQRAIIEEAALR